MSFFPLLAISLAYASAAVALPSQTLDLNAYPPQPQPTICGDIVQANLDPDYCRCYDSLLIIHTDFLLVQSWFLASDAIACLTSVPFNAAVANRFLTYYNQTLQFQSITAFLRQPPPGYQQPALDVFGALDDIQDKVNTGYYRNQYAFEADLQSLSQQTHDTHTTLYAGVTNEFTFAR